MDLKLDGKRALVTGGTRGIGRAVALTLARAGADVLTCYARDAVAADGLARELKEVPGDHHVVQADLARPEAPAELVAECRERLGGLDVIVNNAGVISQHPFGELPPDEWHRVLDTNLTAVYLLIQQALPLLGPGASIVNVGSRVATIGVPQRAHYTASKAGLIGLSRSLAKELGGRDIRVNVVAPGVIETEEAQKLSEEQREVYRQRYRGLMALGRFGRPEDIAAAVLFLASDLSGYVTGETLNVDGGV